MRKHIPHPVTLLSSHYAELDILYGGDETDAMEESMKIACDLRDVLNDGENILYVNTLVSPLRMAYAMGKRFDHGARRGRNEFVTFHTGQIVDKLPFLRLTCEGRGFKYLVITGFELAALDPRHRIAFMGWLRLMRNLGVNVILFTLAEPREHGTLGALRFSARSINRVGEYLMKSNGQQYEDYEVGTKEVDGSTTALETVANDAATINDEVLANEAVVHEAVMHEAVANAAVAKEVINTKEGGYDHEVEFADAPDATKLYLESPSEQPENQHSDSDSLKTKDLALEFV